MTGPFTLFISTETGRSRQRHGVLQCGGTVRYATDMQVTKPAHTLSSLDSYRFSTYLDRLPFVFVLGAAASDAMTTAFTHMTRSLMSVRKFYLPDEKQRLASILREVFFGSRYPAMVLSAQVMEWLDRSLSAYQGSLDAILSHLQVRSDGIKGRARA